MKKIIVLLAVLTIGLVEVNAQSLKSLISGAGKAIENSITDGKVSQEAVVGTWSYSKPAIKLESTNTLANIGGNALSTQITDKLKEHLEKIGIKEGCFSISFTEDGKVSTIVLDKTVTGTYSISEDGKTMEIGYKAEGETFQATVSMISGNLSIMFGGEKFTSFIQTIVDKIPSTSSTIDVIKSFLSKYDNIFVGFEFSKQTENSTTTGGAENE